MTQSAHTSAQAPLEQPIDLLHYVYLLFDKKWIIVFGSMLCGYAAMLYVNSLPNIYESVALVDIIEQGNAGGVDPDNRIAAKSIGLLETGFVLNTSKENYTKIVYSRLVSRKFIRFFMDKHNIYALLYNEHWDQEKQAWRGNFQLDKGKAFIRFERELISIFQNEESQIVAIAVRHTDPVLAAKLANLYVEEFNDYMRQITLTAVATKMAFLERNLEKAEYIEIEKMLYRLMEAQTAAATLANGQKEYALEVVDPATRSYDRHSPARKRISLLIAFASGFFITGLILLIDILRSVKEKLDTYASGRGRKPVIERPWSLRGILLRLFGVMTQPFANLFVKHKKPVCDRHDY
jgi:hypothetical protein